VALWPWLVAHPVAFGGACVRICLGLLLLLLQLQLQLLHLHCSVVMKPLSVRAAVLRHTDSTQHSTQRCQRRARKTSMRKPPNHVSSGCAQAVLRGTTA
jgi:membrane protein implicated in regulation of membrane protease activity